MHKEEKFEDGNNGDNVGINEKNISEESINEKNINEKNITEEIGNMLNRKILYSSFSFYMKAVDKF